MLLQVHTRIRKTVFCNMIIFIYLIAGKESIVNMVNFEHKNNIKI